MSIGDFAVLRVWECYDYARSAVKIRIWRVIPQECGKVASLAPMGS